MTFQINNDLKLFVGDVFKCFFAQHGKEGNFQESQDFGLAEVLGESSEQSPQQEKTCSVEKIPTFLMLRQKV